MKYMLGVFSCVMGSVVLLVSCIFAQSIGGRVLPASGNVLEITNIVISDITNHTAKVVWATSYPAKTVLNYGINSVQEKKVIQEDFVVSHEVLLKNLESGSRYYLEIEAQSQDDYVKSSVQILLTKGFRSTAPTKNVVSVPKSLADTVPVEKSDRHFGSWQDMIWGAILLVFIVFLVRRLLKRKSGIMRV